jgi:hypothetical protein
VYVSWLVDERPAWRVRLRYAVEQDGFRPGRPEARGLADAIAATGRARGPAVRFGGGEADVVLTVKGVDDVEASFAALAIVDSAARDVACAALGELLGRAAVPAPGRPT